MRCLQILSLFLTLAVPSFSQETPAAKLVTALERLNAGGAIEVRATVSYKNSLLVQGILAGKDFDLAWKAEDGSITRQIALGDHAWLSYDGGKNGRLSNPMTDLFITSCTVRFVLRTWIPYRNMKSWAQSNATAKSGCTSVSRRPKNKKPRRSIGLRSIRPASRLAFADSLAEWPSGKPCFIAKLTTRPPRRRQPSDRRQRTAEPASLTNL